MGNNIFFNSFPPHNILAEELFIGIILLNLNKHTISELSNQISIDSLILESHQIIYRAVINLSKRSKLDLVQLVCYLSNKNLLSNIGGLDRILELLNQVLILQKTSTHKLILKHYAILIQDKYVRRLIIQWATYIITLGLSESTGLDSILHQINKHTKKIFSLSKHYYTFSLSNVLHDLIQNFHSNHKNEPECCSTGLKSGLAQLDALTQGFQPSDLIILAGRPGMGKTSLSLNIVNYVLQSTNLSIMLFSFEMSKKQVLYKLLSIQCKITVHKLRNGSVNLTELKKIKRCCHIITQSSLYINDNPNTTIFELHSKTTEFTKQYMTGLIIIDYLQLIQHFGSDFNNRVQELSSITRILKILARETSVPLVVLSQLNRNVETRNNKKPLLSDLRESGCIQGTTHIQCKNMSLIVDKIIIHFTHYISSMQNKQLIMNNYPGKELFCSTQYMYNLKFFDNHHLNITSNHKILTFFGWKTESKLLTFDTIITMDNNLHVKLLQDKISYYDNLLRIKWRAKELVYDIKVNHSLNFSAHKMIIHNSIEQDADLVLLLYRDDYYANNKNPSGLAEIIIAKHRNGPTGTFDINFDASYTIFTNY